ncbi:MAG: hypothetical protein HDR53_02890 [Treponema sp.]|nr:hypothetical protein [Treponema sp.]
MRLLRKHFVAKRLFQQLPNLTIRSLLKNKEGLKSATEMALLILMRVFFENIKTIRKGAVKKAKSL